MLDDERYARQLVQRRRLARVTVVLLLVGAASVALGWGLVSNEPAEGPTKLDRDAPGARAPFASWSLTLSAAPVDLDLRTDGLAFYTLPTEIQAVRGGEVIWTHPVEGGTSGWLLDLDERAC